MNKIKTSSENQSQPAKIILVGTYKGDQLKRWSGWYN